MSAELVDPWDVNPGDTVWNGKGTPGSPATVMEVREPSHGLAAAHGAVVLDVVYGSGHPGTLTRFPHDGKILCERAS